MPNRPFCQLTKQQAEAAMRKAHQLSYDVKPHVNNGKFDRHDLAYAGFAGEYALASLLLASWTDIDSPVQADFRGRCDLHFGSKKVEVKTTWLYNKTMHNVFAGGNEIRPGVPICGLVPQEQLEVVKDSDILAFMAIDVETRGSVLAVGWIETEMALAEFPCQRKRLGTFDSHYPNKVLQIPYEALKEFKNVESIRL